MKKIQSSKKSKGSRASNFFTKLWGKSWTLVKSVVDVVREPVLILDKDLRVIAANETFYSTFKVKQKETQGSLVYKLGNGQWNIPALRKLLSKVLKSNDFLKDFKLPIIFLRLVGELLS